MPSVCRFHKNCVEGLASGTALNARLGERPLSEAAPDDPVWEPVVHCLSAMSHALVCTTGPLRIAMGGGVLSGQPHLPPRTNAKLRASLAGTMDIPGEGAYVTSPPLGTLAGQLGAVALALDAVHTAYLPP